MNMNASNLNDEENFAKISKFGFPSSWLTLLGKSAVIEPQTTGESRADVFRISTPSSEPLFIKTDLEGPQSELPEEVKRLRWMNAMGLPCPSVLDAQQYKGRHWLLMSAVPGRDLASSTDLSPDQAITILAQALQKLHAIPWQACPFDQRPEHRLIVAGEQVKAQEVDVSGFEDAQQGYTAEEVYAQLLAAKPDGLDPVVTHGDACLPNFMVNGAVFSGFIDCSRVGVSDRYQDLALTARSIVRNLGQEWVAPFFECYGVKPDAQRIRFYQLLDEFN